MKPCRVCLIEKPLVDFYRHPAAADGHLGLCKTCQKQRSKERHERLRSDVAYKKNRSRTARINTLKRKYGMSVEDYNRLLHQQGDACHICRSQHPGLEFSFFPVDHDHVTGEVRGLLCNDCNLGLQRFKDNPEFLMGAAAYLLKHVNVLS